MQSRVIGALVLLSAASALTAVTLRASDMVGVYAVIEKTVLEPTPAEPLRIQIWGAFVQALPSDGSAYSTPKRGYLYFSCPAGRETTCRAEWADLTAMAGKGQGIGFGARFKQNGRVRMAADKPDAPDVYPIEMGVMRMGTGAYHAGINEKLKAALKTQ